MDIQTFVSTLGDAKAAMKAADKSVNPDKYVASVLKQSGYKLEDDFSKFVEFLVDNLTAERPEGLFDESETSFMVKATTFDVLSFALKHEKVVDVVQSMYRERVGDVSADVFERVDRCRKMYVNDYARARNQAKSQKKKEAALNNLAPQPQAQSVVHITCDASSSDLETKIAELEARVAEQERELIELRIHKEYADKLLTVMSGKLNMA